MDVQHFLAVNMMVVSALAILLGVMQTGLRAGKLWIAVNLPGDRRGAGGFAIQPDVGRIDRGVRVRAAGDEPGAAGSIDASRRAEREDGHRRHARPDAGDPPPDPPASPQRRRDLRPVAPVRARAARSLRGDRRRCEPGRAHHHSRLCAARPERLAGAARAFPRAPRRDRRRRRSRGPRARRARPARRDGAGLRACRAPPEPARHARGAFVSSGQRRAA